VLLKLKHSLINGQWNVLICKKIEKKQFENNHFMIYNIHEITNNRGKNEY